VLEELHDHAVMWNHAGDYDRAREVLDQMHDQLSAYLRSSHEMVSRLRTQGGAALADSYEAKRRTDSEVLRRIEELRVAIDRDTRA
jgi:hypothetical protein